jgi:hypothetical protein
MILGRARSRISLPPCGGGSGCGVFSQPPVAFL